MIVLLYTQDVSEASAAAARDALLTTYGGGLAITVVAEAEAVYWPCDPSWDDLLLVLYGDNGFTSSAKDFLARESSVGSRRRSCLPVACGNRTVPPDPLQDLKAMTLDLSRLCRRVGAIMGMSLRNRDQIIFVSYRSVDGKELAVQIDDYLKSEGYETWRDEARDVFDGEGNILPGEEVQDVIEKNLSRADLILLIDTPCAVESDWIKLEVDTANGLLIPVLPVFFHNGSEAKRVSRFRSLASLHRGYSIPAENHPIPALHLEGILQEIENFLSEIYRRKLRVPVLVEKEFTSRGYEWSVRDNFIYQAIQKNFGTLRTRVYSHCSRFEGIFDPALSAFAKHLMNASPNANYALYVYDGMVIPQSQIKEVMFAARIEEETSIIILHTQEVAALLHSNFKSLRV